MTVNDLLRKFGCLGIVVLVLVGAYWIRYAIMLRNYPFYIPQHGGIEFYHTPKRMEYLGIATPDGFQLAKSKEIQEAVRAGKIKCSSYADKFSEEEAIMSQGSSGWSMEAISEDEGFRIPGTQQTLRTFSVVRSKGAMGQINNSVSHSGTVELGGICLEYGYDDGHYTYDSTRLNGKLVRAGSAAELPFFTVLSRTWKEQTKLK